MLIKQISSFCVMSQTIFFSYFLSKEVDIKPPYSYKKKPFKGLPPLKSAERDKVPGLIPETVDKYPVVAQIQRLPPLPSIEEQEGCHVV